MCLNNVIEEQVVASEDIVVYKVVYQRAYHDETFYAPYRDYFSYSLGEVMTSKLTKDWDSVHEGFHSFANYLDAKKLVDGFNTHKIARRYYVMNAYIPKGSEYYVGTFNAAVSYASNKLMIVRPLTTWEHIKGWWQSRQRRKASVEH